MPCDVDGSEEDVQPTAIGSRTVNLCLTDRTLLDSFRFDELQARRQAYRDRLSVRTRAEDLLAALTAFNAASSPSGPAWTAVVQAGQALQNALDA